VCRKSKNHRKGTKQCGGAIFLISFVFIVSLVLTNTANAADPNLVGWWKFDEDSGNVAYDSTDYWNDGILYGGPQWVAGYRDGALQFDGTDDYVNLPIGSVISTLAETTFSMWVNWSGRPDPAVGGWQRIIDFGTGTANYIYLCPSTGTTNPKMRVAITANNGIWDEFDASFGALPTGWHHIAITVSEQSRTMILYLDGNIVGSKTNCRNSVNDLGNTTNNWLGRSQYADPYFNGSLDDFQIYDRVLSQSEIKKVANPEMAFVPIPADGSTISEPEVVLHWDTGIYAVSHDVYFGEIFDDVNDATISTASIYKGRQSQNSYPATGTMTVELGKTYYWRVDEVNDLHPNKLWRGSVWSFRAQPLTAYEPSPPDGAEYVDVNVDLAWSPGTNAKLHNVYFGTTDPPPYKRIQTATTYEPGTLEYDTIYYWRIDERGTDATVITGDMWSFRTMPFVPIIDPNLVGWWQLDDNEGTRAVDSSGYYYNGTLMNGPQWAYGQIEGALQFDGIDNYVNLPVGPLISTLHESTMAIWVNFSGPEGGVLRPIFNFGTDTENYTYLSPRNDTAGSMHVAIITGGEQTDLDASSGTLATGWHHVAVVLEQTNLQLYLDGQSVGIASPVAVLSDLGVTTDNWLGRPQWPNDAYFSGSLDDFRIYNKVLTQDEIIMIMRGDPLLAWNPSPANGVVTDVEKVLSLMPLTWSPGEKAARHDVYFSTDADAIRDADISDTTGLYRGQQDANSFTPAESFGASQTYYWRIDEINTDATVSKGRIWSFTVADYLIVDDFEDYDDVDNRIFDVWTDFSVNNTGMTVGHLEAPFAEQIIVHGGSQAMYMRYDNDGTVNEGTDLEQGGTLLYSEAERTWEIPQDWTRRDVNSLTIWFRGLPPIYGSFTEGPPITMTARGTDIWGTADEFHFAYKRLSGSGSITARVVSITNTDPWAKAGVMIRDSLEPDSAHAMVIVSPSSGVAFQRRTATGGASETDTQADITAPQWVRLTRSGNNFTAEYSTDGADWQMLGVPLSIPMSVDVYIGLCLTSNNVDETCTAEFSDVTTDGTGDWQSQDIGIESNIGEQLYVVLEDSAGSSAVVNNSDPAATTIDTWTEWNIPLTDFADVNLQAIKKMIIGVGDPSSPDLQPGGAGTLYIDDIGLYLP